MPVVYDLKKSEYMSEFAGLKFYFSSPYYQAKFLSRLTEFIESQSVRIYSMYKTFIAIAGLEKFLAISLYQQIEKRGCRIIDESGSELNVSYN